MLSLLLTVVVLS